MTINKTRLVGAMTTGAFLAGVLLPGASFAATVKVKGNGAFSKNGAAVVSNSTKNTVQVNKTGVVNAVGVLQNTGKNKASFNTGGNVTVGSGNATSTVKNTTTTGGNSATLPDCGCPAPDDNLVISGNGAFSHNHIFVANNSSSSTTQVNETFVVNAVLVGQNTGGNSASFNTGGTTGVDSGNASSTVTNTTTTGGNTLL